MKPTQVRWWYILSSVFAFWFVGTIDKVGISLVVTDHEFLSRMGLLGKPAEIGLIVTLFTIVYAVCNPLWGWATDRWGPRRAAIWAGVAWGVMCLLSAVSVSYGMLLASRMLLGAAEAPLWLVGTKLTANWFHVKEQGRAQAIWFFGNNIGPAIGALALVAIIEALGWRYAFVFMAIIALAIVVPMFVWLTRDRPEEHWAANAAERDYIAVSRMAHDVVTEERHVDDLGGILANWRYWAVVVTIVFFGFIFFGLQFWLPTYLKTVRHFAPAAMAGWTSVSWVVGGLGTLVSGWLVDRTRRAAVVGTVAAAWAVVAIYWGAVAASAPLAAALLSFGFAGQQAGAIASLYLLQQTSGGRAMGRSTGIMIMCSTIIGGFAPTIIGAMVQVSGGSYLGALLFLVACCAVAGLGFGSLIPREREFHTAMGARLQGSVPESPVAG